MSIRQWTPEEIKLLIEAQRALIQWRREHGLTAHAEAAERNLAQFIALHGAAVESEAQA